MHERVRAAIMAAAKRDGKPVSVWCYENGIDRKIPMPKMRSGYHSASTIRKVAIATGVSADWLLGLCCSECTRSGDAI